ncbi:hypothetical protein [Streptomyces beigongshangae]|uniref:hypothetical protein n=1 Tax=Streptomyces beigongshangae TaxID=2841597 RepID=UPI001C85A71B|nr:hypothetical protein [Streptomyces sp. REN17]
MRWSIGRWRTGRSFREGEAGNRPLVFQGPDRPDGHVLAGRPDRSEPWAHGGTEVLDKAVSGPARPRQTEEERGGDHPGHFGVTEPELLLQESQGDPPVRPVPFEERRDGLLNDIPEEEVGQDTVLVEDVRFEQVLEAGHSRHQVPHQLDIALHRHPFPRRSEWIHSHIGHDRPDRS